MAATRGGGTSSCRRGPENPPDWGCAAVGVSLTGLLWTVEERPGRRGWGHRLRPGGPGLRLAGGSALREAPQNAHGWAEGKTRLTPRCSAPVPEDSDRPQSWGCPCPSARSPGLASLPGTLRRGEGPVEGGGRNRLCGHCCGHSSRGQVAAEGQGCGPGGSRSQSPQPGGRARGPGQGCLCVPFRKLHPGTWGRLLASIASLHKKWWPEDSLCGPSGPCGRRQQPSSEWAWPPGQQPREELHPP